MPDLRTVNIFEVDSLARLVFVVAWILKELVGELSHVIEVVSHGEGQIFLVAKIARLFDWVEGVWLAYGIGR